MSRAQVKEIRNLLGSEDMQGMFDEMMGIKDADPTIIRPKFVALRNAIKTVYKLFRQIVGMEQLVAQFPSQRDGFIELHEWNQAMREAVCFEHLDDDTEEQFAHLDKTTINSVYKHLKESQAIRQLMLLCSKLKQYKDCIGNEQNLSDTFILEEPGHSLRPFSFAAIDLKLMWISDEMKAIQKKQLLIVMHRLWHTLYLMYKIITSPDVDIEKFTHVLRESIMKLKTVPELSRCTRAFARIEESVELLGERFDEYYRESIASANPNIIMENFVLDVSKQGGADAQLTRDFRRIIMYMQKMSQKTGRAKDPKVKKLFDLLNKNYEVMERATGATSTADTSDQMPMPEIDEQSLAATDSSNAANALVSDAPISDADELDLPIYTPKPAKKSKAKKKGKTQ